MYERGIPAAVVRETLSDLVNRSAYGKERHVVTRHGKPLAALVPIEDLEFLEELEDRVDVLEGLEALAEAEEKGTHLWGDLKAELGL